MGRADTALTNGYLTVISPSRCRSMTSRMFCGARRAESTMVIMRSGAVEEWRVPKKAATCSLNRRVISQSDLARRISEVQGSGLKALQKKPESEFRSDAMTEGQAGVKHHAAVSVGQHLPLSKAWLDYAGHSSSVRRRTLTRHNCAFGVHVVATGMCAVVRGPVRETPKAGCVWDYAGANITAPRSATCVKLRTNRYVWSPTVIRFTSACVSSSISSATP